MAGVTLNYKYHGLILFYQPITIPHLYIFVYYKSTEMPPPVYIVKPKNIFKHPFNKFDLDKPTNRESQNDDITDYFNYGFNEDTMNIYGKLVKRNIQVLDESINPTYFDAPSELMRLNDQIPMDFGGFCKFFDPSIFIDPQAAQEELEHNSDFHNGQRLFKNLIAVTLYKKPEYPLIDFVKGMYRLDPNEENWLCDVMDQIQQNLQRKYEETIRKLIEKKNNPTGATTQKQTQNGNHNNDDNKKVKQQGHAVPWQTKEVKKQQEDGQQKIQQESSKSSSQSDSDDSDSDSSQNDDKKKKKNKDKSRSRDKDRSRKDKDKDRDRKDNKHKKIKKDSRSRKDKERRDKDKDRDRSRKDKKKDKSSKKKSDKDRDRSRSRKKDKRKKRRD